MELVTTASAVIDALGGTSAVQALTKRKYPQSVSNWRKANRLPPDTLFVISAELAKQGKSAPVTLFGFREPECAA